MLIRHVLVCPMLNQEADNFNVAILSCHVLSGAVPKKGSCFWPRQSRIEQDPNMAVVGCHVFRGVALSSALLFLSAPC